MKLRLGARGLARGAVGAVGWLVAGALAGAFGVAAAALVEGDFPGGTSWSVVPVLVGTAVGALAWGPLRRWTATSANRLLGSVRRSPDDVVRAFATRSGRDTPVADLLVQLAETLLRELDAGEVQVWRESSRGELVLTVAIPTRDAVAITLDESARQVLAGGPVVGRAWLDLWEPTLLSTIGPGELRVVPAAHAGVLLGLVVVARRAGSPRFDTTDDTVLAELGERLGAVLHNRELDATLQDTLADLRRTNEELRASRGRLVATADAERRRLERDLHDGAQQHLVALAVNLRLAESALADDPDSASGVLRSLGDDVREAIAALRALAHGIYPPVLIDAGPVEALHAVAARHGSPVTIASAGTGRHSPEVEAAVYFCCTEALQNAAKHAPGAAVRIEVSEHGGTLRFRIDDDGPGIADDVIVPGHGLGNIVDRLGALGGSLTVGRSETGGARLTGEIPVATSPAELH